MAWLWWRIFIVAVFAISLMFDIYVISKNEKEDRRTRKERPRYRPYLSSYILPMYVLMVAVILAVGKDWRVIQDTVFRLLGVFLHISLYYGVLLLLMPSLRRWFSSRVCAVLWIIPNYLYIFATIPFTFPRPLFSIPLPAVSPQILIGVWLAGFVAVMGWKCVGHLRFRKRILSTAVPVTDAVMLRLWGETQSRARLVKPGDPNKRYIPLVQSEQVSTPLAVGLMRHAIVMVMPKRSYSEEELIMIFQHEVIHIGREDSWTKFFLVFCTAFCWFNPLMWMAGKRCAEDVELSCDETVLLEAEADKRKQYAQLLLKTAGDDRGFTTCLSATGQAMRYRLGQVMEAPKRRLGLVLAAVAALVLFTSFGFLPVAYDCGTATDVIMQGEENRQFAHIRMDQMSERISAPEAEKELYEYLSQLQAWRLSGYYEEGDSRHRLTIQYENPGYFFVLLYDQRMEVFRERVGVIETYYLSEPVDWEYVQSILTP